MLEEAKQKYLQMRKEQAEGARGRPGNYILTFNTMLQEIEAIAVRHTRKYFSSQQQRARQAQQPTVAVGPDDFEFAKVREMYKIIIVPDKSLRHYFGVLPPDEAKRIFRTYALHIHPDKNSHPNAKIAFQKLFKAFIVEPTRVAQNK